MDPKKKYHCPICDKNCCNTKINTMVVHSIGYRQKFRADFYPIPCEYDCYKEQTKLHCDECDITWTEVNDI